MGIQYIVCTIYLQLLYLIDSCIICTYIIYVIYYTCRGRGGHGTWAVWPSYQFQQHMMTHVETCANIDAATARVPWQVYKSLHTQSAREVKDTKVCHSPCVHRACVISNFLCSLEPVKSMALPTVRSFPSGSRNTVTAVNPRETAHVDVRLQRQDGIQGCLYLELQSQQTIHR